MERTRIAIVIPAFNEAKTIKSIINKCLKYGTVIVVDDGSQDNTIKKVLETNAILIKNKTNLGYDKSLNAGFKKALVLKKKYVITLDADNQHDPKNLKKFIKYLDDGYEVVVGKRPYYSRFSEKIYGKITNNLFGFSDPLCGMKGYNILVYRKLGQFDNLNSVGTQLTIYAAKRKLSIKEIDININERFDNSRFGGSLNMNFKIFRAMIVTLLYS